MRNDAKRAPPREKRPNRNRDGQTQPNSRFYELRIDVPESYPAVPPKIRFVSRVNMGCVDKVSGEIIYARVPATKNWNRNTGIE